MPFHASLKVVYNIQKGHKQIPPIAPNRNSLSAYDKHAIATFPTIASVTGYGHTCGELTAAQRMKQLASSDRTLLDDAHRRRGYNSR